MNKKAAIELSIGTIVIVVLVMSMLILGMVLVRNIFSPEETIEITDCKIDSYVEFNCTDGQEGVVSQSNYFYIQNNSNCTQLNNNLFCIEE